MTKLSGVFPSFLTAEAAFAFVGAIILSGFRYWLITPTQPWSTAAFFSVAFIGAALGAVLLWRMESLWLPTLQKWIPDSFDPQHPHRSPLRHALLLVLLPILGFFVLSSSQTPVGLGFIWGVLLAMAKEVRLMLMGHQELEGTYFGEDRDSDDLALHRGVMYFFLVSTVVLSLGIMIW